MGEVELPELPELEKEERRDKLNTLVAVTVTLLVTFMAMCKIEDNNIVLRMDQAQADKVDKWSWMQALNIREDIMQSKLADIDDDARQETVPGRKKFLTDKLASYDAKAQKITDKKTEVKAQAKEDEERYESLNKIHENFDKTEGAISIAVSLLAMTSLLQKRWMYGVSLIPAVAGVIFGALGLIG